MGVALRSAASRRAMGLRSSAGCTWELLQYMMDLVAEVVRGHGGPPPKSLNLDENFKPEHTLFFRDLRTFFHFKNSASWTKSALLHGIYCMLY